MFNPTKRQKTDKPPFGTVLSLVPPALSLMLPSTTDLMPLESCTTPKNCKTTVRNCQPMGKGKGIPFGPAI